MNKPKSEKENIELLTTTITDLVVRHTNPGLADSWPINSYLAELYGIAKWEKPVYPRAQNQFERQTNRRTDQMLICLANDDIPVLTVQRNPNTVTVLEQSKVTNFYSSLLAKLREVEKSFELKLLIEEDGEGSDQPSPIRMRGVYTTRYGRVDSLDDYNMRGGHISFADTVRPHFISVEELEEML